LNRRENARTSFSHDDPVPQAKNAHTKRDGHEKGDEGMKKGTGHEKGDGNQYFSMGVKKGTGTNILKGVKKGTGTNILKDQMVPVPFPPSRAPVQAFCLPLSNQLVHPLHQRLQ
jgi:hypothetical protein